MDAAKLAIGTSAIATFCLILFVFQFASSRQVSEENGQVVAYQESHVYRYSIGETAVLDSSQDDEGESYGWIGGFDWNGTLKATVREVAAYQKVQNAPLDERYYWPDLDEQIIADGGTPLFVLLSVDLENVDAVMDSYEDGSFNISVFQAVSDSVALSEFAYFDGNFAGTGEGSDSNGYHCRIEPGQTRAVHIGFFADESILSEGFHISVGMTGLQKYVFEIKPSDIETR